MRPLSVGENFLTEADPFQDSNFTSFYTIFVLHIHRSQWQISLCDVPQFQRGICLVFQVSHLTGFDVLSWGSLKMGLGRFVVICIICTKMQKIFMYCGL